MTTELNLNKLLGDVFAPSAGERVLVMVDLPHGEIEDTVNWQERRVMAETWRQAFSAFDVEVLPLGQFPATGRNNGDLPETIQVGDDEYALDTLFREVNVVLAFTQFSATAPLARFAKNIPTFRAASMPGVLKRMEKTALAADYTEVARKVHILADKLTNAEFADVEFSTGDELRFDLRFRRGLADDGQCHANDPHRVINLPSGEAFIVPYEGERPDEPSQTEGFIPVTIDGMAVRFEVEKNQIVRITGDEALAKKLTAYFEQDGARRNVAELGLGCNQNAIVAGCVLEDEKAGFHWAYGRSEHLGGTVGPDAFTDPSHVVHQDIVYAAGCPHTIAHMTLTYPDKEIETIIHKGDYTV